MARVPSPPPSAARLPAQFARFAAVGAVTTAVQYAVLWVGVAIVAAPAAIASAAGYALGVLLSYALNYAFTFRSTTPHFEAAPKFLVVFGVGWCLNLALMGLFVHRWGWNPWPAQVLTTGIGLVWNFSGSRWWTFRRGLA
jgi:putative flippase GtrA